jgi:hypothetical protein
MQFATGMPDLFAALSEIPGVISNPATDVPTKVKQVHDIFNRVKKVFEPLVTLAAGLDYGTAGNVLSALPDPSGAAPVAGMILNLVGNLDIVGVYNSLNDLSEQLWKALETGDVAGAAVGSLPALLQLVTKMAGMLTGGTKTDASQIGQPSSPDMTGDAFTGAFKSGDISSLASGFTKLLGSDPGSLISTLVSAGSQVAQFFGGGSHQSYANNGEVDKAKDYLDQRIGAYVGTLQNTAASSTSSTTTSTSTSTTPTTTTAPD